MAKEETLAQEQDDQLSMGRATTDVNIWTQIVGSVLLTVLLCAGLYFANAGLNPRVLDADGKVVEETVRLPMVRYLNGLINQRGPVQWCEVLCFFVVIIFVIQKARIIRTQIQHLYEDSAQLARVNMDNEEEILQLRKQIHESGGNAGSILFGRLDRGLALWLASKDVGRVSGSMNAEGARDTGMSDLTYTLARTMIWAIPIFGFIGTVQGLSSAVGGFADFLSGAADLSAIKGAIADVTIGLGVAFDTTFLALVLVMIVQFPLASVMRRESSFFGEIDIYLDEHFISRLPSAEQQPVVIENLEDSIEAAFRRYIPDPDRYEEVFTESIEKAGAVVEKQFEGLTAKYVEARKEATDAEIRGLAEALENAHIKASELAREYAHSADGIQTALQSSLEKAADAAAGVTRQVASIADLGTQIRELLQVEQAMEKALSGISQSASFQQTLTQLREHLATTDEFCRRLSKPRVITLHEEVIS
ncbi:MAG: MotA/TolQ/ExbB proton channel family protein [Verrucomicrobiota bacterium]|jgi:cell fate (sporulation/competence/biofilm development) regulator YlbF (YheA/YmcA/DUF963 family)|nr:MotA/TolQ/ExbB proton channel family protein [Verrucomicrobiota bacterium]